MYRDTCGVDNAETYVIHHQINLAYLTGLKDALSKVLDAIPVEGEEQYSIKDLGDTVLHAWIDLREYAESDEAKLYPLNVLSDPIEKLRKKHNITGMPKQGEPEKEQKIEAKQTA